MKICIVVPHYDHLDQFTPYLPKLAATGLPMIIVDDASPEESAEALATLLDDDSFDATLICHAQNQGKGGAVISGLRAARDAGYSHALQIDADGQHDAAAITQIVAVSRENPGALICGVPVYDESVSKFRFYARHISLWFARLETLSMQIRDALCGFRIYPLQPLDRMLEKVRFGRNMAFDCEILVRTLWAGIPLRNIPVRVSYPSDGKSHFHYLRDNVDISWMHTRLIVGMLLRLPVLLSRKLVPGSVRK